MNENLWDQELEQHFQVAFGLTLPEEGRMLAEFHAKQQENSIAWHTFATVMIGLHKRLQPAMNWLYWPLKNVTVTNQTLIYRT